MGIESKETPEGVEDFKVEEVQSQEKENNWGFEPTKIDEIEDQDLKGYLEYINKHSPHKIDIQESEENELTAGINMFPDNFAKEHELPSHFEGKVPKKRLMQFLHHLDTIDYSEIGIRGTVMAINARASWRTFSEEREGQYDKLNQDIASQLHDQWRAPRKLEEGSGYDPRWKDAKDEDFAKHWQNKLKPGEVEDNVRMTEEGEIEIDIANSQYSELSKSWQQENQDSAAVAVFEVMKLSNYEKEEGREPRILPQSLDVSSAAVHREWLKRNPWGEDDAIMRLPFHVMKLVQKGDISKLEIEDFLVRISDQIKTAENNKGETLSPSEMKELISDESKKQSSEELEKDRDVTFETIKQMKKGGIIDDKTIH